MRDALYRNLSGVRWRVSVATDESIAVGSCYPHIDQPVDRIEQAWMTLQEARDLAAGITEAVNVAEAQKEQDNG